VVPAVRHIHTTVGFCSFGSGTSLFLYKDGAQLAYLLLYVDDIVLTACLDALLHSIIGGLHTEFAMTDLGALYHFLGILVTMTSDDLFLSQRQYDLDLLQHAGMSVNPPPRKLTASPSFLHRMDLLLLILLSIGVLLVPCNISLLLVLTSPMLSSKSACLCMIHGNHTLHLCILRYVKGTLSSGLQIGTGPVDSLTVTVYSDADWAGCPDSRCSTSGYCVYLGDTLVSWSLKRQTTVSRSSAEAEYRAIAHIVANCCLIQQLLQELHLPLSKATVVYCDNVSAVYDRQPSSPSTDEAHLRLIFTLCARRATDEAHRDRYSLCAREGCSGTEREYDWEN